MKKILGITCLLHFLSPCVSHRHAGGISWRLLVTRSTWEFSQNLLCLNNIVYATDTRRSVFNITNAMPTVRHSATLLYLWYCDVSGNFVVYSFKLGPEIFRATTRTPGPGPRETGHRDCQFMNANYIFTNWRVAIKSQRNHVLTNLDQVNYKRSAE